MTRIRILDPATAPGRVRSAAGDFQTVQSLSTMGQGAALVRGMGSVATPPVLAPQHRYYRVYPVGNPQGGAGQANNFLVNTIELRRNPGDVDYALGKAVSAGPSTVTYGTLAAAVDGNPATAVGISRAGVKYFEIDLANTTTPIYELTVRAFGMSDVYASYEVWSSADASTWLWRGGVGGLSQSGSDTHVVALIDQVLATPYRQAQFYRVVFNLDQAPDVGIEELLLLVAGPPYVNHALASNGATVTASATGVSGTVPSSVIDGVSGSPLNVWWSGAELSPWLEVRIASKKPIEQVSLWTYQNGGFSSLQAANSILSVKVFADYVANPTILVKTWGPNTAPFTAGGWGTTLNDLLLPTGPAT